MKNSEFNSHEIKKCCENKLEINFRDGSEFNGWFFSGQIKIARITIPHGRKPVPPKTYKSMATQLKLNINEFDMLLDCTLNREGYLKIINELNS